jgi:CheY-like chemotaxis protein
MDAEPLLSMPMKEKIGLYKPILVLSPDTVCRRSLRKKLEDLGYMTLGADTPGRASDVVDSMRPGLIVTDIPEDWVEFANLVGCARNAGVRIILTSLLVQYGNEPRLAVHGYLKKPFDKYEIVSFLAKCRVRGGLILLLSSDGEESRTLQVLLGAAGFGTVIQSDFRQALQSCEKNRPAAIFVSSYPRDRLEDILLGFKDDPLTREIPVFLILGAPLDRYVTTVTLEGANHTNGNEGLYKLVGEIEAEYAKRVG